MSKIGIYGGTFDPVHHGHLILAREALETLGLDEIIFVPATISPHKVHRAPTPADVRLEMVRRAIEGQMRFCLDDLELRRPPPSYTVDTVEELQRRYTGAELFYLVGSDNVPKLNTWHRADELRRMVQFVVLHRGNAPIRCDLPIVVRNIDISATDIRNRVATGRSIRYLVPPAVEELIQRHQLYREPRT
ncbi:MAG TPA: nicotinate-nucleotide adenylyltransferase [Chthoniobacterales bacterium]|nr:nicotinate-nucleotide adenylyltransferase [Chthoniobacterales bacterium]